MFLVYLYFQGNMINIIVIRRKQIGTRIHTGELLHFH